MSTDKTDGQLLQEFAQKRSEEAFRQLTQRHLSMVFSTAFRGTGDHTAAEEISQNVFVALAKKAAWLQWENSVAAWLHRVALLEARQWWRAEMRRRTREQAAVELESIMKTSPEEVPALAGVLDEALMELRDGERQAVLLRYFEGLNNREIGAALCIGEDAARKRVDRGMEQLIAAFRRRGFAVGSAAAIAAAVTETAQAIPVNLASATIRAALSAGPTVPPLAAKFLGMGKMQLAGVSLALLLIPAVWQQARLHSAQGEQRRLEALLARIELEQAKLNDELVEVEANLFRRRTAEDSARVGVASVADTGGGGTNSSLFLWNESAGYIRVPKAVLERVGFGGSRRDGLTFDKDHERISEVVLGALGLSSQEQQRVQEVFAGHFKAYTDWIDSHGYLAEFDEVRTNLPKALNQLDKMVSIDGDTRVWVIPAVSGEGSWGTQFQKELATVIGDERAGIIMRMARDDMSLDECFRRFGLRESYIVIAPDTNGGFWMVTHLQTGAMKTPGTFSQVLNPLPQEPFDEDAARREITENIRAVRLARSEIRDEDVPPMEVILREARQDWDIKEREKRGHIHNKLGRSLPKPVLDYLRDWLARHPETPDATR